MKSFLFIISIIFSEFLFGQQTKFPVINSTGKTFQDFVPQRWTIIDTAFGDLNKDNVDDIAMIIQSKDTINEYLYNYETKKNDISEQSTPRILIVIFKNNTDGKYHLAVQNNDFILRPDEGGALGDPLQGLQIKNNTLNISFYGGSREHWSADYIFRFQNNDWFLIGASYMDSDDLTGDSEEKSYNFSTKKSEYTTGLNLLDKKIKGKTEWKSIPLEELKTLKTFIRPFTWEIEKGFFL